MRMRVAILGIYHESNTFLHSKTTLKDFERGHLLEGAAIREEYGDAYHEIGGMLEVLDRSGLEAVPLVFAEATPGGIIEENAARWLMERVTTAVRDHGPFDGILVAPHGAAVAEKFPDMDGWWLQELRSVAGDETPIISTLDPHANVSKKMVDVVDAFVAYKTNPHIDQRQTGAEAATLMVRTLRGEIRPTQRMVQPAATISIEQQYTPGYPCTELYAQANTIADQQGVLSTSVLLGFPYADVAEMGSAFVVVTNNDPGLAEQSAERLGQYLWNNRRLFVGEKRTVDDVIQRLGTYERPVLLLDMGDNVGGGSPGDSTFLLKALEQAGRWRSFVCIYDPDAVQHAGQAGVGNRIRLAIGGKTDTMHGKPYETEVSVSQIADGIFRETQPRHGGQVNYNMGTIAVVETAARTTIMLTSLRAVPFSLNQLTTFGILPETYDVIVAKGVHAPVAAYQPVCRSIVRVNTDGITHADMTRLSFRHRRKPLFPFEDER